MYECSAFSNHFCLDITGSYRPCCRFDNNKTPIKYSNEKEYFAILEDLHKKSKKEKIDGCHRCYKEEENGKKSYRQRLNDFLSGEVNHGVEFLEIGGTTECNMKCRMCDSKYSSLWYNEINKNSELLDFKILTKPSKKNIIDVFSKINVKNLKMLKWVGGEPFLSKEFLYFLNYLNEQKILQNINVFISSNASFYPEHFINLLKQTKKTEITFSIDGTEKLAKYIRYPIEWDDVKRTIDTYKNRNNFIHTVTTTVQAYNLNHINEIGKLCSQYDFAWNSHLLEYPQYLSLSSLPTQFKEKLIFDDCSNHKDFLKKSSNTINFNQKLFSKLITYTDKLDFIRDEKLKDANPELFDFISEYKNNL